MHDVDPGARPARVADIDLLACRREEWWSGAGATLALLRIGSTPVGQALLSATGGRSPAEVIARALTADHADRALRLAISAWLRERPVRATFQLGEAFAALAEAAPQRGALQDASPAVTVAVCTRDRPQHVRRAIGAIAPLLREDDELLVIVNAGGDPAATVMDTRPRVRYVAEPRPGLAWARNRAIVESRHEILLFTDDDCEPDACWVEAHRALFARNPDVDIVTGLIEPIELTTQAQRLFERYGGFPRNYRRRWIHAPRQASVARVIGNVGELGAGANFAIRRRLWERIGPFDPALGPGTVTSAGDDLEMLFRGLKSGALLACEPRAVVRHEHRREAAGLTAQIEGWSRGFSCAIERSILAYPEERRAYRTLRTRIALLYHGRRAVFSQGLRRLAIAELKGMRGAASLYDRARRKVESIAASIVSPAADAAPHAHRSAAIGDQRADVPAETVRIDLESLRAPIACGSGAASARVAVYLHGQQLGEITLPVFGKTVGEDRMRDCIIDRFGSTLVGCDWGAAVASTRTALVDGACVSR